MACSKLTEAWARLAQALQELRITEIQHLQKSDFLAGKTIFFKSPGSQDEHKTLKMEGPGWVLANVQGGSWPLSRVGLALNEASGANMANVQGGSWPLSRVGLALLEANRANVSNVRVGLGSCPGWVLACPRLTEVWSRLTWLMSRVGLGACPGWVLACREL